MASLVPDENTPDTPEEDPLAAALKTLADSSASTADSLRAMGLAIVALTYEQQKTNRLLRAQKKPPTMAPPKTEKK